LKYPRDTFFSRGQRAISLNIPRFEHSWIPSQQPSELNWSLKFQLPRGSYATMVIRQLFTALDDEPLDLSALDDSLHEESSEDSTPSNNSSSPSPGQDENQ
jgi:hypothetical protein